MNKQNKKSFNQILTKEYKIILLYTFIILLIPIVIESVVINTLLKIQQSSPIEQLYYLYEPSKMFNLEPLFLMRNIISGVAVLLFAACFARKLNGQRLLYSIRDAFKDIISKRFWSFILKIYIPLTLMSSIGIYIIVFTLDTLLEIIIKSPTSLILTSILLIVLIVILLSIIGAVFVCNIAYLRGTNTVREVFKALPNREIVKLVLFNLIEAIIFILIVTVFVVPLLSMEIMMLLSKLIPIAVAFLSVFVVFQIIFTYLRVNLYMNIASKIEVKF